MSIKNTPPESGIRTRAIHSGEKIDPVTRASAPALVMSSTFSADPASAGFSAADLTEESGFVYSRWGNPTVQQLERKVADLEGAESCLCCASGMGAIMGLICGRLSAGDHLVAADTAYAGTSELIRQTLPRMGIDVTTVNSLDPAGFVAALRPETKMVWLESPANPIMRLTDLKAVADAMKDRGVETAVDSTFATPIATRPLELGIDYVVHALTKYIGGHGDAMGGAILGSTERLRELRHEAGVHFGAVMSPFNAWLIMRGAATLPLRMQAHEETAMEVARFLEEHPRVGRVLYPGLPSHPQHDLARRQMANFSGMMAFQVKNGARVAEKMFKRLKVIHYAVSLGHHRSLICWIGTDDLMKSSFQLSGAQLDSYREWAGDGVFRLSVGLEDAADLCADLDAALAP